jgi:molybdopterin molybdotransferase
MISVAEAKRLIAERIHPAVPLRIDLDEALGRVLAADLYCPLDLPPFRQSSMDGYALITDPTRTEYEVVGETPAGYPPADPISPGEAIRIFTGAALPKNSDTVVKQEEVHRSGNAIRVEPNALQVGAFVRETGSDIAWDSLALEAGTELSPAVLGFVASMGIRRVHVHRPPDVSLLVSGDELVRPGRPLRPGQIYESNSYALRAAIEELRPRRCRTFRLRDDKEHIRMVLWEAMGQSDVLVFSGGISVGEYDYIGEVLNEEGVETIFHGVAQKPGKPMFFGVRDEKSFFALPGNPASTLVCFYEYVYPALREMIGYRQTDLREVELPISHDLIKRAPRAAFERARIENGTVRSLAGQESYMLKSLADANALLVLPEGEYQAKAGDLVTVHILPHSLPF